MKKTVYVLLLMITILPNVWSQGPPPPMAMASEENQILIDEIVEISKLKEYYNSTCSYYINQAAELNGWDNSEILKRKKQMDFDRFIRMNFYSFMADYSKDELIEITSFLKKVNKRTGVRPFFLINQSIENNLRLEISSIIK